MIDWESLITNKNLKAKTKVRKVKVKKLNNIKSPKSYFIAKLLQWEQTYWDKQRKVQNSTYNPSTNKLNVHTKRAPYKQLDLDILINNSKIIKKPIMDTFLKGQTFLSKELTPKESKSKTITQISTIENVLETPEKISFYAFLMSCGYEELDLLNNKIKIKKQWRKFSKEYRNYLIKEIEYNVEKTDEIIQKISKAVSSKKTEIIVWSVNPIDFLKQSAGTTWDSCHRCEIQAPYGNIRESYLSVGHQHHPWISQSLDEPSSIAFVLDPKTGLLKTRIPVYINTGLKEMVIGRAYPNASAAKALIKFIKYKAKAKGYTVVGEYTTTKEVTGPFEFRRTGNYGGYADIHWRTNKYTSQQIKYIYSYDPTHLRKEIE